MWNLRCRAGFAVGCVAIVVASQAGGAAIVWNTDADGDWNNAGNWSPASVPSSGDDATIDRPGSPTVTHATGATTVQSLTNRESLVVTGGSTLAAGAFVAGGGSSLEVDAGATFAVTSSASTDGAGFSARSGGRIDLNVLTSYSATNQNANSAWTADGAGSRIEAAGVTTLTGSSRFGRALDLSATAGGTVDLGGVTEIADGNLRVDADGVGSVIDLGSLGSAADTGSPIDIRSSLTVSNGGEIRLATDPGASISLRGYVLTRDGAASSLDTRRVTDLSASSLTAVGTGTSFDLSGLGSYDSNSFIALDGAELTLTPAGGVLNAHRDGISDRTRELRADGATSRIDGRAVTSLGAGNGFTASLDVNAFAGGAVDLSNVTTVSDGNARFTADGAGSAIDISAVANFVDHGAAAGVQSTIEARDGASVRLGANVGLEGYRLIRDGAASTLDSGAVTSATDSFFVARGTGTSLDLTGLASYDSNSFEAEAGALLTLTPPGGRYEASLATVRDRTRRIAADGTGSRIDGSALTSLGASQGFASELQLHATNGASVDLQGVSSLSDGNANLLADGAASSLDVSGITLFRDTGPAGGAQSVIEARDGGTVLLSSTPISVDGYRVIRDGSTSNIGSGAITDMINSTAIARGAATTLDLSGLSDFDANSFEATGGAWLTIADASYSAAGGNDRSRSFVADGTASLIDGTAITRLTGGLVLRHNLEVRAQRGGVVDLSSVTTLDDSNFNAIARNTGSVVDLSHLTAFGDTGPTTDISSLEARSGGEIRLSPTADLTISGYRIVKEGASSVIDTTRLTSLSMSEVVAIGANTSIDLDAVADLSTNSLKAESGASLGVRHTSYDAGVAARTFQAKGRSGPTSSMLDLQTLQYLSGATGAGAQLDISATQRGAIDLSGLLEISGGATTVAANDAGSQIVLTSLERFEDDNANAASTIRALGGGTIALNATGTTEIVNVDLIASDSGRVTGNEVRARGQSVVRGSGVLELGRLVNEATVAPGGGAVGELRVTGDYVQSSLGTFAVDIGGTASELVDHLIIDGDATLDGLVSITFFDGDGGRPRIPFDPQIGDFFDVLFAASILDLGIAVANTFADDRIWLTEVVSSAGESILRLRVGQASPVPNPVPAPMSLTLMVLATGIASAARRISVRRSRRRGARSRLRSS